MRLRTANIDDAAALIRIKKALPMPDLGLETSEGGFLLGTDQATYETYLQQAYCLIAEGESPVGFGIIFPDELVRASELWQKREAVRWAVNLTDFENKKLGYFEQLAFLPYQRRWAIALAYHLVKHAFRQGHEVLFMTTVNKPILNLAALPFIRRAGGFYAGNIDEYYPGIGAINSDIYGIRAKDFVANAQRSTVYPFLESVVVS